MRSSLTFPLIISLYCRTFCFEADLWLPFVFISKPETYFPEEGTAKLALMGRLESPALLPLPAPPARIKPQVHGRRAVSSPGRSVHTLSSPDFMSFIPHESSVLPIMDF